MCTKRCVNFYSESASKYVVPALEFCSTQEDVQRVFSYLRKYCFYSGIFSYFYTTIRIVNLLQLIILRCFTTFTVVGTDSKCNSIFASRSR